MYTYVNNYEKMVFNKLLLIFIYLSIFDDDINPHYDNLQIKRFQFLVILQIIYYYFIFMIIIHIVYSYRFFIHWVDVIWESIYHELKY